MNQKLNCAESKQGNYHNCSTLYFLVINNTTEVAIILRTSS